jgi:hypothetical protein
MLPQARGGGSARLPPLPAGVLACRVMRAPLWLTLLCAPVLAQQTTGTTVDIARCMDIKESAERIRCYDALADEVRARPPAPAGEEDVQTFGKKPPARVVETKEDPPELHDRIAALRQTPTGRWIVTLASGQVWQQSVSTSYNLRSGMDVRIYRTRFGNGYRLSAQGLNGFIQFQRIK